MASSGEGRSLALRGLAGSCGNRALGRDGQAPLESGVAVGIRILPDNLFTFVWRERSERRNQQPKQPPSGRTCNVYDHGDRLPCQSQPASSICYAHRAVNWVCYGR